MPSFTTLAAPTHVALTILLLSGTGAAALASPGYPPPPGPYHSGPAVSSPTTGAAQSSQPAATVDDTRPGMLLPDTTGLPAHDAFGAANLFGGAPGKAPSTYTSMPPEALPTTPPAAPPAPPVFETAPMPRSDFSVDFRRDRNPPAAFDSRQAAGFGAPLPPAFEPAFPPAGSQPAFDGYAGYAPAYPGDDFPGALPGGPADVRAGGYGYREPASQQSADLRFGPSPGDGRYDPPSFGFPPQDPPPASTADPHLVPDGAGEPVFRPPGIAGD